MLRVLPKNIITRYQVGWLRLLLHGLCLWLLAQAYWRALNDTIGGDPVESLLHFYGISGLRLLLLSLAITPLVRYLRQSTLMRLRRPLGLWAAAFALAHLGVYVVYELQWQWREIVAEIIDRPYITVGFVAWLLLLALAVTSLPVLVRRLGRRWKTLHKTVYVAALLICIHFLWSVKADLIEPGLYFVILALLLFVRRDALLRDLWPGR